MRILLNLAANLFENVTFENFVGLIEFLYKQNYLLNEDRLKVYKYIWNFVKNSNIKIKDIDMLWINTILFVLKENKENLSDEESIDLEKYPIELKAIGNIDLITDNQKLSDLDIEYNNLLSAFIKSYTDDNFNKNSLEERFKKFLESIKNEDITVFIQLPPIIISKIVKEFFKDRLINQEFAIEKISDSFKNTLLDSNKPIKHNFLLIGPPATGKTYTAKLLSEVLNYPLFILNLGNYVDEKEAIMPFVGTDSRFSNSRAGDLTLFLKNNPRSIVVFDEFEKAPLSVQYLLLSMFNEGKLYDKAGLVKKDGKYVSYNQNRDIESPIYEVECDKAIFIFTSNLGKDLYNDDKFWKLIKDNYTKAENRIIEVLKNEKVIDPVSKTKRSAIIPELLSRLLMGDIILYKHLNLENLIRISKNFFDEYLKKFENVYNLSIKINNYNELIGILLLNLGPKIDIRKVKSKIGLIIFDVISDFFRENLEKLNKIKYLNITFNKKALEKYNKEIKNKKDILKEIFRKNLELNIDYKIKEKNDTMQFIITDINFTKVENIKDFDTIVFDIPNVSFDDIHGHKKVKEKLKNIIKLLKKSSSYAPKGMLLYGPPGTGKTLLAKALANESELPFIATTGAELRDIKRMKEIFNVAKDYAPCVIFIDEIDAIGRRDKMVDPIVVNELLTQIDGFNKSLGIFIIAATNYYENIDPALLRSGRIDLHFEIPYLDKEARRFFIEEIIKDLNLHISQKDIDKIVSFTSYMNGADLSKLQRELKIKIELGYIKKITLEDIIEEINIIKYGETLDKEKAKELIESTAIHEASHAVISKILFPYRKIEQITVMPRKESFGFVSFENEEKIKNLTKEDLFNEICVSLSGRLGQIKKYKEKGLDTGADSDLQKATLLAYTIIANGMSEKFPHINIEALKKLDIKTELFEEIQSIINKATKKTEYLIDKNFDLIQEISSELIKKEVLTEEDLNKYFDKINNASY